MDHLRINTGETQSSLSLWSGLLAAPRWPGAHGQAGRGGTPQCSYRRVSYLLKSRSKYAKYKGHCFPHFQPALEIKRETVLADRFVPRGKKKSRFHQVEFRLSYFSPRHFWVPSAVPPTRAAAPRLQSFPSAPLGHPGPSRVTLSAAEPRCCPGHRIVLTLFKVNTKGDSEAGV